MKAVQIIGPEINFGAFGLVPLATASKSDRVITLPPIPDGIKFRELFEPSVGEIVASNVSTSPLLVPAGWVLDGLNQTRMVTRGALVEPGEDVSIRVACVEQGRWGDYREASEYGRAPLSLLLAAGALGPHSLDLSTNQVQQQVWTEVQRHESRNGTRHSSNLAQILSEDSQKSEEYKAASLSLDGIRLSSSCSGYIITLNGEVLLAEMFPQSTNVEAVAKSTMAGLIFDTENHEFSATDLAQIEAFVEELNQIIGVSSGFDGKQLTVLHSSGHLKSSSMFYLGDLCTNLTLNASHKLMKGNIYV